MTHTPLALHRVIPDRTLRDKVAAILATVPASVAEQHGITLHLKRTLPRALVFWGDFPPAGDALAKRIRDALGPEWQVSQAGPPQGWGSFRTATVENPYRY